MTTNLAVFRANPKRCVHEWRTTNEGGVTLQRCARCDVLRAPRWHVRSERPDVPEVFHAYLGAAQ
jgi:hypothetical protein